MNSKSKLRRMAVQQPLDMAEWLAAAQRALAAADRLVEAYKGGPHQQFLVIHSRLCPFVVREEKCNCGLDEFRDALTAYLAERGKL